MVEEEEKRISSKGWSKMIRKIIIDASIEPISDTKYRIVGASTDNPEQLKQTLSKASSWRE